MSIKPHLRYLLQYIFTSIIILSLTPLILSQTILSTPEHSLAQPTPVNPSIDMRCIQRNPYELEAASNLTLTLTFTCPEAFSVDCILPTTGTIIIADIPTFSHVKTLKYEFQLATQNERKNAQYIISKQISLVHNDQIPPYFGLFMTIDLDPNTLVDVTVGNMIGFISMKISDSDNDTMIEAGRSVVLLPTINNIATSPTNPYSSSFVSFSDETISGLIIPAIPDLETTKSYSFQQFSIFPQWSSLFGYQQPPQILLSTHGYSWYSFNTTDTQHPTCYINNIPVEARQKIFQLRADFDVTISTVTRALVIDISQDDWLLINQTIASTTSSKTPPFGTFEINCYNQVVLTTQRWKTRFPDSGSTFVQMWVGNNIEEYPTTGAVQRFQLYSRSKIVSSASVVPHTIPYNYQIRSLLPLQPISVPHDESSVFRQFQKFPISVPPPAISPPNAITGLSTITLSIPINLSYDTNLVTAQFRLEFPHTGILPQFDGETVNSTHIQIFYETFDRQFRHQLVGTWNTNTTNSNSQGNDKTLSSITFNVPPIYKLFPSADKNIKGPLPYNTPSQYYFILTLVIQGIITPQPAVTPTNYIQLVLDNDDFFTVPTIRSLHRIPIQQYLDESKLQYDYHHNKKNVQLQTTTSSPTTSLSLSPTLSDSTSMYGIDFFPLSTKKPHFKITSIDKSSIIKHVSLHIVGRWQYGHSKALQSPVQHNLHDDEQEYPYEPIFPTIPTSSIQLKCNNGKIPCIATDILLNSRVLSFNVNATKIDDQTMARIVNVEIEVLNNDIIYTSTNFNSTSSPTPVENEEHANETHDLINIIAVTFPTTSPSRFDELFTMGLQLSFIYGQEDKSSVFGHIFNETKPPYSRTAQILLISLCIVLVLGVIVLIITLCNMCKGSSIFTIRNPNDDTGLVVDAMKGLEAYAPPSYNEFDLHHQQALLPQYDAEMEEQIKLPPTFASLSSSINNDQTEQYNPSSEANSTTTQPTTTTTSNRAPSISSFMDDDDQSNNIP